MSSSSRVLAVVLGLAIGTSGLASESPRGSGSGSAERLELLSTWWSPASRAGPVFAWSRLDVGEPLVLTWWQPVRTAPRLFAFSSPDEDRDLTFAWSRPDETRGLLFTWSQTSEAEAEGAGSPEPAVR